MARAVQAKDQKPATSAIPAEGERFAMLLGKAATLVAEKGFHHMSMRDLSRATDYSLAGLYHYFGNKEDVLFQIQQRFFSTLVDQQSAICAGKEPVEERLRALVQNHLAFFTKHADELKVCTYELHSLTGDLYEQVAKIRRRYFGLLAEVLQELLAEGEGKPSALRVRQQTMFVFGALNWIFMWYDADKDGPAAQLGDELSSLVLHGLRGLPPRAAGTSKRGKGVRRDR